MSSPQVNLPKFGSLWMLIAALGFALMGALVKTGASKFSSSELVFYRSIFGLICIYSYIFTKRLPVKTPHLRMQISRAIVGLISLALFFYAIAHLPLATAITLNYTSALFLAILMPFVLNEKPKFILFGTVFLGFTGVVLLLKPSFSSSNALAGASGLLSGFGAAWAYIHVKQLGKLNEPDWRTVFYFTLISSIASGLWMLMTQFKPIEFHDLPILVGLGAFATVGQLAMTRAYRTGNTLVVASLAYVTVVIASVLGATLWHESLHSNDYAAIGLIIISGIISVKSTSNTK